MGNWNDVMFYLQAPAPFDHVRGCATIDYLIHRQPIDGQALPTFDKMTTLRIVYTDKVRFFRFNRVRPFPPLSTHETIPSHAAGLKGATVSARPRRVLAGDAPGGTTIESMSLESAAGAGADGKGSEAEAEESPSHEGAMRARGEATLEVQGV